MAVHLNEGIRVQRLRRPVDTCSTWPRFVLGVSQPCPNCRGLRELREPRNNSEGIRTVGVPRSDRLRIHARKFDSSRGHREELNRARTAWLSQKLGSCEKCGICEAVLSRCCPHKPAPSTTRATSGVTGREDGRQRRSREVEMAHFGCSGRSTWGAVRHGWCA